jgi:hypothetical protein
VSESAQLVVLVGLVVTALGAIGGAFAWLVWPRLMEAVRRELQPMRAQVAETHKQVTVNGHSNEQPTVLDILSDLRAEVRGVDKRLDDHLLLASKADADMWRAIEAVAKGTPPDQI